MLRKFYKMHGIGNDYIYFDCLETPLENPSEVALKFSDRHFGIGGDGVVLICPPENGENDAKMRMFNADGSEGKMCGNAIRCVGKFLYDFKKTDKTLLKIETLSGVKTLWLNVEGEKVNSVKVDMGAPTLSPAEIPVLLSADENGRVVSRETEIGGGRYAITCVSMGNPHCVAFLKTPVSEFDLEKIGSRFEVDPLFPERVNAEFVNVIGENEIAMRVWERGSGETWACGTGACASAVAAVLNGYAKRGEDILVRLRGGNLTVNWSENVVYMTGTATFVFEGEIDIA